MNIATLTTVHTALSFIAIFFGIIAAAKFLKTDIRNKWINLFLAYAAATTITGFFFPISAMTPALATGIVTSATLLITYAALYIFCLKSAWRWVYISGVIINVYLLFFVLIAQAFSKIPALHALAPTLSEPPFAITQLANLIIFLALGVRIIRRSKASV